MSEDKPEVRTRQRPTGPAPQVKQPPEMWPNGCVFRNSFGKILGITIPTGKGSYDCYKLVPVFVGHGENHHEALTLLTKQV